MFPPPFFFFISLHTFPPRPHLFDSMDTSTNQSNAAAVFLQPPSKSQIQDWEHACARDSVLCGEKKFIFRDWLSNLEHELKNRPPMICKLQHQPGLNFDQKYSVSVKFLKLTVGQPCSVSRFGDVDFLLTPERCRLENLTYSSPCYVEISVETEEPSPVGPVFKASKHTFYLTDIPVMVDNKICGDGDFYESGEIDDGGYYLCKGKERIVPMHRSTDKYATVAYQKQEKNLTCMAIRSGSVNGKNQSTRLNRVPESAPTFKFFKGGQPWAPCALLRALGVEDPVETLRLLSPDCASFYGVSLHDPSAHPLEEKDDAATQSLFAGTDPARKPAAVVSALRMLHFMERTKFFTERDSVISQTVESVGEVLSIVFDRAVKSTMSIVRQRIEQQLRKIHNLRTDGKKHRKSTLAMPTAKSVAKCMFRFNNIGSRMLYFVSTGNLVGGGDGSAPRVGMCQLLERTSRLQKESGMQKIVTGLDSMNAPTSAREFSLCSLGRICMVSTPEGKRCGLVGQKALGARVSRDRFSSVSSILSCVSHLMLMDGSSGAEGARRATNSTAIWVSGKLAGLSDKPVELVAALRSARREGQIPRDVGVSLHGDGTEVVWVEIRVHAGRLLRPLVPLDKYRPPMPKGTTWSRYISEGYIEMLDAREEMVGYVARMEEVATEEHTHREVFHAASLGCVPSCIPFLDHEPVPRGSYFTNQAQQTTGHDPRVFANRMTDSKAFQMWYPQRALVTTSFEESSKANETAPQGQNVCVAILSLQDCEEDAIVVSRAAVDRGLFRCTEYNVKTVQTADRQKKCFAHPNVGLGAGAVANQSSKWAALDPKTGIARVGKRVRTGDAIAAIATDKRVKTVTHGAALPAVVDRVLIFDEHVSGHRTAKIRLRTDRPLALGDKLASRFSQKGITSRLVNPEDMPWVEDGSGGIDIIVNPCFLPSRMTIGQLMEHLCGFACSVLGMRRYDASAFAHSTLSILKDLESKGFKGNAKWLRCPVTGERFPNKVEIGICQYHRLNKFASDKMRVRTTGRRDHMSNQPSAGREAGQKALRLGGMEMTALSCHGGAYTLNDASRDRSDGTTTMVCKGCGNLHLCNHERCPLCNGEPVEIQTKTATLRMIQIFESMNIGMNMITEKKK